jgi:beta-glucanase (GH16 family)
MARVGTILATAFAVWVPAAGAAPPPGPPTWADEFDGVALDASRWSPRATGPRNDGNLTPDAVSVGNGVLTIQTYTEGGQHFSGMISTAQTGPTGFEQTYGYFEARMRFHDSPGEWSAFWLQSQTIGNPIGDPATAGVEMDIAEHRARRCVTPTGPPPPITCSSDVDALDRVQQAQIWDGYGPDSKSAVQLSDPLTGLGNDSFHTFALRWSPTDLTFFYDNTPIWTRTSPISRRSQYIILSSEVGQFFAGNIPPGGYGTRATSSTNMQVDYVRVWALAPVNTAAPVASGTPAVGQGVACSNGSWAGDPAPAFGYQWLSDGAAISGAAAPTYTVQSTDQGHGLSCLVTAVNSAGSASAQSNTLPVPAPPAVLPGPAARLATSPPPAIAPFSALVVDRTAPSARLSGSTSQKAGTTVAVTIACLDEPCRATATSTVRVPKTGRARARTYKPAAIGTSVAKGQKVTVRLRLSRAARASIGRALRAHKRVFVTVKVRFADGAGNSRSLTRRVALRR